MGRSDQAAFAELKNHHKAWLSSLEETAEVEGLLFCHGTPDSDTTYLMRNRRAGRPRAGRDARPR